MAKRGVSRNPGYKPGSNWDECDYCGFQFRIEDLKITWDGFWACDEDWQERHPQDFLRAFEDKIAADNPGTKGDSATTTGVTFAESFTVPSGTFDNEI